jgi:branched-chain amino acid transport system substrate-binding protein
VFSPSHAVERTLGPAADLLSRLEQAAPRGRRKDQSKFGSVYYNAGVVCSILYVEALRTGHKKFVNRPLTPQEGQWALEHLDITPERIEELGATSVLSPLKVTQTDHEGDSSSKIVQWDGKEWQTRTDWLTGDRALFDDAIYEKAAAYAKEKNLPPRDPPAD